MKRKIVTNCFSSKMKKTVKVTGSLNHLVEHLLKQGRHSVNQPVKLVNQLAGNVVVFHFLFILALLFS